MPRARAFTLIELLVVLIILGVLAAVALPRFIDTRDRALLAKLHGMRGSLVTAVELVHAQAQLQGLTDGVATISVAGANIRLHSGYPQAHWNRAVRYLIRLDTIAWTPGGTVCEAPWCGRGFQRSVAGAPAVAGRGSKVWPEGYEWTDRCGVYYINNEDGTAPLFGVLTADC